VTVTGFVSDKRVRLFQGHKRTGGKKIFIFSNFILFYFYWQGASFFPIVVGDERAQHFHNVKTNR
jgi:hypothetical protein